MRKPIVDDRGRMRLAYFEGNDKLKKQALVPGHDPINISASVTCETGAGVAWLGTLDAGDHHTGAIVNFTLTASGTGSVGIALEDLLTTNHSYMPATDLGGGDYHWFGVNYVSSKTKPTQLSALFRPESNLAMRQMTANSRPLLYAMTCGPTDRPAQVRTSLRGGLSLPRVDLRRQGHRGHGGQQPGLSCAALLPQECHAPHSQA